MKSQENRPVVGDDSSSLGIRVPYDIVPDNTGNVHPGNHGMSVSPSMRSLPMVLIPRRLKHIFPKAVGSNNRIVWKMGEGDWAKEALTAALNLEIDLNKPDKHGFVSPSATTTLDQYRADLAATQSFWSNAESAETP